MHQLSLLIVPADAWLVALVETSLRLSVILLVAGAIAMVLRRSSANLRHLVWALALAGALLLPLGASYLPTLSLPVPRPLLAFARTADGVLGVRLSETQSPVPAGVMVEGTDDAVVLTVVPAGAIPQSVAPAVSEAVRPPVVATAQGPGAGQPTPPRTGVAPSWQQLVLGLWLTGVVVLLLRIGVGIVATCRIARCAERPRDGEWARLAAELGRRIGLTRPVRILSSGRTSVPMTWGWVRPVVLVPEAGAVWSVARKRVVLLHELNHVKRHDCASQLVAHVACAVYWFNPLVWCAARALRVERERACDEAVVRDGTPASSYADHLLEIARTYQGARWASLAAVAMARRSQLEGRLLSILDAGQRRRPSRRTTLVLGTVMAGVILIVMAVTPTMRAATPVEAGVQTALTATMTEMSPEGAVTLAPTDRGVPAVGQTPAPVSPQTPAADIPAARDQVAREGTPALSAAVAVQGEAQAMQRKFADQLARRVLERETLALVAVSQDSARREQLERAEIKLIELKRHLEQIQDRTGRIVRIGEREVQEQQDRGAVVVARELERALEIARRAADFDVDLELDGVFNGMRIAEEIWQRLNVELGINGIQRFGRADRRPLDPRVVELFLESLRDDDAEVRERAAWGLGRNRVEEAVGSLANTLGDETPEVRERAAWALGRIRSPSAVPGLGAALDDPEVAVRIEVVEALGHIRDAAAVEPLVGALRDSEPRVRREAAESLGRIRNAGAVDGLVAALGDSEPAVVEHAAEALGMIRDARAVAGLVRVLQHQDPEVAKEAAEALGRIRSDEAVDGLVAGLRDAQGEMAEEIVEALGRIGGDRALDALIEVTGDASPAVRKAVIEALSARRWSSNADPNPTPNPGPQ